MKGLITTMDRTATDFFEKRLITGKKRTIIALVIYSLLSAMTFYLKYSLDGLTAMNLAMTVLVFAIIYEAWKGQKTAVAILVGTSVNRSSSRLPQMVSSPASDLLRRSRSFSS